MRERGDRTVDITDETQRSARAMGKPLTPPPMTTPPAVAPARTTTIVRERTVPTSARGTLSIGAVLTGVLVALGALLIFTAIGAAIAAAFNIGTASAGAPHLTAGWICVAIAVVLAQYFAYLWGGYTAGRMARGAGPMNGFCVPLVTLLIGFGAGAIARGVGFHIPRFTIASGLRFGLDRPVTTALGFGVLAASLLAMFVGGTAGGVRGVWWHNRLEAPGMVQGMMSERVSRVVDEPADIVDTASEESFPASDPPSYTRRTT
jgi:hypothetical protein